MCNSVISLMTSSGIFGCKQSICKYDLRKPYFILLQNKSTDSNNNNNDNNINNNSNDNNNNNIMKILAVE